MKHVDFTDVIADALRPHGEGEVDVAALRAGTMARVRAARRRRAALVTVAAVAAFGVVVATVPRLVPEGGRGAEPGAPPSVSAAPSRPVVRAAALPSSDAPGAAQRPDTVGTDRGVLHFDVDLAAFHGTGTWWRSGRGVERGEVWTGPGGAGDYRHTATVVISQSLDTARAGGPGGETDTTPVEVTVAGRPGQTQAFPEAWGAGTTVWTLWWQPVDGLWAVVTMEAAAGDPVDAVVTAAEGVRFDRSQRCAVPIRLDSPPAGTEWESCTTAMEPAAANARSWQTGSLSFRTAAGGTLQLSYGNFSDAAVEGANFVPNRTVAGRPAMWYQGEAWQLAVPDGDGRNLFVGIRGDGVTEQDALALAAAAVFSDNLIDLSTWPARPVG
ncbi:hypothetical protein Daura_25325 [Dactylosporangium aurantiacum]|uniref:Uncharacterized protein n=1 Tax=Dactylosporangium aurantiacum TaxID=35754 RepID=A0A9Q9MNC7_9ACTN|nr:hypothetical protein [Dactylosporangium aurantiacum]MDG6107942.1 hypothetical protein [Dactylosporangium aurantiacum]UWZ59186.1 hypothetical protein Daura_25325 [Dactylosporangium aurantiacum]